MGFTLVEILVSMAIIGVLSVMLVVVTAPSDAASARTEARRLAAIGTLLQQQSHGRPL